MERGSALLTDERQATLKTVERLILHLSALLLEVGDDGIHADVRQALEDIVQDCRQLAATLQPVKVVVAGRMMAGKSKFLNALVGVDFLAVGKGGVAQTAVMTEVERRSMDGFSATVFFRSSQTIAEYFAFVLQELEHLDRQRRFANNDADGFSETVGRGGHRNSRLEAIKFTLKKIFRLQGAPQVDQELVPRRAADLELDADPGPDLVDNIDRAPLTLYHKNLSGLMELLRPFVSLPNQRDEHDHRNWQVLTIDSVRIVGNFENLPFGLVLVDSPGLGDVQEFNSERTMDAINACKHIWLASSSLDAVSNVLDSAFLRRILIDDPRDRKISIVCTKFDELLRSNGGGDAEMVRNRRRDEISHLIANMYANQDQDGAEAGWDDAPQVVEIPKMFVGFTSVAPGAVPEGIDTWRQRLGVIGNDIFQQQQTCRVALDNIRIRIHSFGVGVLPANIPVDSLRDWVSECGRELAQLKRNPLINSESEGEWSRIYDAVQNNGLWTEMHPRTLYAAMDEYRQGVFMSRGKVRQSININEDIAFPWVNAIAPVEGVIFLRRLDEWSIRITRIIAEWKEKPEGLTAALEIDLAWLRSSFLQCRSNYFSLFGVANLIRTQLCTDHWLFLSEKKCYGSGRCAAPSRVHVNGVWRQLCKDTLSVGEGMHMACSQIIARLHRRIVPIRQISDGLHQRLKTLVDDAFLPRENNDEGIPYDFICPIHAGIFENPVITPCGHTFCLHCIEQHREYRGIGATCPMDRQILPREVTLLPNRELERAIRFWQEQQPHPRNPQWWTVLWQAACFSSFRRNM